MCIVGAEWRDATGSGSGWNPSMESQGESSSGVQMTEGRAPGEDHTQGVMLGVCQGCD